MRDEVFRRLSELADGVVSELGKLGDDERVLMLMAFFSTVVKNLGCNPLEATAVFELLKFKHLYETLTEALREEKGGGSSG